MGEPVSGQAPHHERRGRALRVLYVAHNARDEGKGAAYADASLLSALRSRGHEVDECWDIGSPRRIRHDNLHLLLEAPERCETLVRKKLGDAPRDVVLVNQPLGYRAARFVRRHRSEAIFVLRSHGWEPHIAADRRAFGGDAAERSRLRRFASRVLEPLLLRQNAEALRWAHGLVVGSEDDRGRIVASGGLREERILVVEPGLPPAFLEAPPPARATGRDRRLLYVGQFTPSKAPEVAAAAMAAVLRANPAAEATWVCSVEHHTAVQGLFPPSLRARVTTLSWMPRRDLVGLYDQHGLFVFPSHCEGFGQTFLEAMSRGLVVLATRVGGMKQVILDGENGYLFETRDAQGIAARALTLQQRPDIVSAVGARAREAVQQFTWERAAEKLERFLLRMIASDVRHGPAGNSGQPGLA